MISIELLNQTEHAPIFALCVHLSNTDLGNKYHVLGKTLTTSSMLSHVFLSLMLPRTTEVNIVNRIDNHQIVLNAQLYTWLLKLALRWCPWS